MIKNKAVLEVESKDRTYTLICEQDSPLGELHDVLMQMKGYTVDRMKDAQLQEQEIKDKMCQIDSDCAKE